MPKIIIDTNSIVFALIQINYPLLIVDFVLANKKVELCISDDLLKE